MKKIIIWLLLLAMTSTFMYACSKEMTDLSKTHIGGAILKEAAREESDDIYSKTSEKLEGYGDFNRTVTVYGLTLIVHKDISDDFINKVSETLMAMFPRHESMDLKVQEKVLQNMYRYKAALPIVKNESDIESVQSKLMKDFSVCDIIMKVDENQTNEVVEHLLHAVSDVGLHYTYPDQWGLTKTSDIHKMMQSSIEKKYYDVKDYKGYPEDVLNRVLIQEYAYWTIVSIWDLEASTKLGGSEWRLTSSAEIEKNQPELLDLYHETLKPIMIMPVKEVLNY